MDDRTLRTRLGRLLIVTALAAAILFVRLGVWQLSRLSDRRTLNKARESALSLGPVEIGYDSGEVLVPADSVLWRRVRVAGRWDPDHEFVLRGRAYLGTPGVQVVTLLRPVGSPGILVLRGWLPAADGVSADLTRGTIERDTGLVQVEGLALPFERPGPIPRRRVGYPDRERPVFGTLDRASVATELDEPVAEWVLQVLPPAAHEGGFPGYQADTGSGLNAAAAIRPLPAPALNDGPHALYAFQWFGFALIAVAGAILLPRAGRIEPRVTPPPGDTS